MNKITIRSGMTFDLRSMENNILTIEDVASSLSKTCRFGGHCLSFYSVAQHSVLVSEIVPEEFAFQALLHDASEAILHDMTSPLKKMLPDYQKLEKKIEQFICETFNVPLVMPAIIKAADLRALATEKRDLMPKNSDPEVWGQFLDGIIPDSRKIAPMLPRQAEVLFLERAEMLLTKEELRR